MSALDLATIADVRGWLSLNSGLPANSAQTSIISTTSASIAAGNNITVTPATMANISTGMVLGISNPVTEYVAVLSTTGTTFNANFAIAHPETTVAITDQTDVVIQKLITSASVYMLRRTSRVNADSSIPAASTLNSQVLFNEWYDGNGNDRLFLRFTPLVSVSLLQVNGITIPASTGFNTPGYVIDNNGRSLAIRSIGSFGGMGWTTGAGAYYVRNFGPVYNFAQGTQNINVQYTAGFASTPQDVNDAITQMVGWMYISRRWIGQQSVSQPDNAGTIQYSKLTIPAFTEEVIDRYSRTAMV